MPHFALCAVCCLRVWFCWPRPPAGEGRRALISCWAVRRGGEKEIVFYYIESLFICLEKTFDRHFSNFVRKISTLTDILTSGKNPNWNSAARSPRSLEEAERWVFVICWWTNRRELQCLPRRGGIALQWEQTRQLEMESPHLPDSLQSKMHLPDNANMLVFLARNLWNTDLDMACWGIWVFVWTVDCCFKEVFFACETMCAHIYLCIYIYMRERALFSSLSLFNWLFWLCVI